MYPKSKEEKYLEDVVKNSNSAYDGKFWNRHLQDFQRWEEQREWYKRLESFCSRMWLDHEDENLTVPASGNRLSKKEYIDKYEDWLIKKFLETDNNGTN